MMHKIGILIIDYPLYMRFLRSIEFERCKGNISVEGISLGFNPDAALDEIDGYRVCIIQKLFSLDIDYLIVAIGSDMLDDIREKLAKSFPKEKIFSIDIFGIDDFDFDKYMRLVDQKVTIISQNCWGGMTYHALCYEFLSPTINLFFEDDEGFIRFTSDLGKYVKEELVFEGLVEIDDGSAYPVASLLDVRIHFMHYGSFEEAKEKWELRKKRINWDNIVAVMRTEDREAAIRFERECGYRKIVFTPEDFGIADGISLQALQEIEEGKSFGQYLNMLAAGELHLYNAIDILL